MRRRPALVLSPAAFNDALGLAYIAPISTKPKGHAFELELPADLAVNGVVMIHQLKSLDWRARRASPVGRVPATILAAAAEIIKDIIDAD